MQKNIIGIFAIAILSVFIFVTGYSQEDMTLVDSSVFENPQRTPSLFSHDEHNEAAGIEECINCHHVYLDGQIVEDESSEDQSCSECHSSEASESRPALMQAFHANCKGCHLELKKGPIMCGECHVK